MTIAVHVWHRRGGAAAPGPCRDRPETTPALTLPWMDPPKTFPGPALGPSWTLPKPPQDLPPPCSAPTLNPHWTHPACTLPVPAPWPSLLQGRRCSLSPTLQGWHCSLSPTLQGQHCSLSPTLRGRRWRAVERRMTRPSPLGPTSQPLCPVTAEHAWGRCIVLRAIVFRHQNRRKSLPGGAHAGCVARCIVGCVVSESSRVHSGRVIDNGSVSLCDLLCSLVTCGSCLIWSLVKTQLVYLYTGDEGHGCLVSFHFFSYVWILGFVWGGPSPALNIKFVKYTQKQTERPHTVVRTQRELFVPGRGMRHGRRSLGDIMCALDVSHFPYSKVTCKANTERRNAWRNPREAGLAMCVIPASREEIMECWMSQRTSLWWRHPLCFVSLKGIFG